MIIIYWSSRSITRTGLMRKPMVILVADLFMCSHERLGSRVLINQVFQEATYDILSLSCNAYSNGVGTYIIITHVWHVHMRAEINTFAIYEYVCQDQNGYLHDKNCVYIHSLYNKSLRPHKTSSLITCNGFAYGARTCSHIYVKAVIRIVTYIIRQAILMGINNNT